MKILVTGGSGFIGSAFVRTAILAGHKILNVDLLTYAASEQSLLEFEDNPDYRFEKADIRNRNSCRELVLDFQPDAIVHLAAETHVDRSIDDPSVFIDTNINGTFNLLEVAREFWKTNLRPETFKFLHVSTDEVYGSLNDSGLFEENSAYAPQNPYSASKAASDHLVQSWANTYGLPVIITHCSNNYGMYQSPEKLVPKVIINAMNGREIPVYGDGLNVRDWIYVEDHADALMTVLESGSPGCRFNIGSRNELRNIELVKTICLEVDRLMSNVNPSESLIRFVQDRPGHDKRYGIDPSRIEAELNWQPKTPIHTGLRKTVDWYFENEWWWKPIMESKEANLRIGLAN